MNSPQDNSTTNECVLDMTVIEGLRELGGEDDPGLVTELIGMFLDDAPKRIEEIETSLATGDIKLLERAAHTLKSSAANVGAMGLSRLCRDMEEQARSKEFARIPVLCRESKQAFDDAARALRAIR